MQQFKILNMYINIFLEIILVCHHVCLAVTEHKLVQNSSQSSTYNGSNPEHPMVFPLILDYCWSKTSGWVDTCPWI